MKTYIKTLGKGRLKVDKKLHPRWYDVYNEFYEYDNRVVKVFDYRDNKITMEKIDFKYTLDEYTRMIDPNYTNKKFLNYFTQFSDIWNNFLKFSYERLNDEIFMHNDYSLVNCVIDLDDNLRVIDPDSCKIVSSKMKLGTYLYASAQLFEVQKRYYK
tara:strand:+ start:619 stop:1089 length:471 start_codon:yes stop_codon:yes gene_type:complete